MREAVAQESACRTRPGTGLRVSTIDGSGFAGALCFATASRPRPCRTSPSGPPVAAAAGVEVGTAADWNDWWASIARAESGRVLQPSHGSVLAGLYESFEDDVLRWVASHEADGVTGPTGRTGYADAQGLFRQGEHSTDVIPVPAAGGCHCLSDDSWSPRRRSPTPR